MPQSTPHQKAEAIVVEADKAGASEGKASLMQTFLPYPDFAESHKSLDGKRLGNQIYREALTLIRGGWPNHPASRMWTSFGGVDYRHALAKYALAGLRELTRRGRHYPHHYATFQGFLAQFPDTGMPPWLGDPAFHRSHQSNLIRKLPAHYQPLFPDVPPDLPYVWPLSC